MSSQRSKSATRKVHFTEQISNTAQEELHSSASEAQVENTFDAIAEVPQLLLQHLSQSTWPKIPEFPDIFEQEQEQEHVTSSKPASTVREQVGESMCEEAEAIEDEFLAQIQLASRSSHTEAASGQSTTCPLAVHECATLAQGQDGWIKQSISYNTAISNCASNQQTHCSEIPGKCQASQADAISFSQAIPAYSEQCTPSGQHGHQPSTAVDEQPYGDGGVGGPALACAPASDHRGAEPSSCPFWPSQAATVLMSSTAVQPAATTPSSSMLSPVSPQPSLHAPGVRSANETCSASMLRGGALGIAANACLTTSAITQPLRDKGTRFNAAVLVVTKSAKWPSRRRSFHSSAQFRMLLDFIIRGLHQCQWIEDGDQAALQLRCMVSRAASADAVLVLALASMVLDPAAVDSFLSTSPYLQPMRVARNNYARDFQQFDFHGAAPLAAQLPTQDCDEESVSDHFGGISYTDLEPEEWE